EPRAGPSGGEGIAEARRHRVEVAGEACQIVELTVALRFGLALVVKQLDADFEIVAQLVSPVEIRSVTLDLRLQRLIPHEGMVRVLNSESSSRLLLRERVGRIVIDLEEARG